LRDHRGAVVAAATEIRDQLVARERIGAAAALRSDYERFDQEKLVNPCR
jgi:hypothetical protein